MQVWNVLQAARWKYRMQKNRHLCTIAQLCWAISSQLRHVSTIGKKLLDSNISCTCPHNMANFGPLAAEIGLPVRGIPANFNGFSVLASLLHLRRTKVNQTLHDVWCVIGWYIIYTFFWALPPWRNFSRSRCNIYFASKFCVILHWQRYCTALDLWVWVKLCGMLQGMQLRNFRHVYSAGRPSRWALAHILVLCCFYHCWCNH